MDYVDEMIKYTGGRNSNPSQERALKLVEPELAAMARGNMGAMPPMSKSAPDRIPMRPYAKGGKVEKDAKMENKMSRKRDAQDALYRLDRAKLKHERESAYDDRKMRATDRKLNKTESEMRKGGKATKSCMNTGGKVAKMAAGGAAKVRHGMATPSGAPKKVVKVTKK